MPTIVTAKKPKPRRAGDPPIRHNRMTAAWLKTRETDKFSAVAMPRGGSPVRRSGKSPVIILNESIATLNEEITALWGAVRTQREEIDALHKEIRDLKEQLSVSFTFRSDRSPSDSKSPLKSGT